MWKSELKLYFLNSNNAKIHLHISKGNSLLLLQTVHIDKSQLQSEVSKACLTGFYILHLSPCVETRTTVCTHLQSNSDPPDFNTFYRGESNPWCSMYSKHHSSLSDEEVVRTGGKFICLNYCNCNRINISFNP